MAQAQAQLWRHTRDARALLRQIRDDDRSLTRVFLVGKGLNYHGARDLACALEKNTNIQELWLKKNEIGDDGVAALTGVLQVNSTISHLDLRYNRILDGGAKSLAQMMCHNSTIKSLYLGGNSIKEEGGRALAMALVQNNTLEVLYLSQNSVGDEGAEALAWAVCLNSSLKSLWLHWNRIGEKGTRALNTAVSNLGGEGIDQDDITVFASGLFKETAPIHMGPKKLGAIKQNLAAGAGSEDLCLMSGLAEVPRIVKRAGQKKILEAVYAAGMKKVVNVSIPIETESAPLILEKVGTIIGFAGVFGILREQHGSIH